MSSAVKLRAFTLAFLIVVSVLVVGIAGFAGTAAAANTGEPADLDANDLEGDGDEGSPYLITNASELQAMEDDLGAHYRLDENIDASETEEWNGGDGFDPVGVLIHGLDSSPFTGEFDGDGHEIRDLTVNRHTNGGEGLFGATDSATISNVSLVDVDIDGGGYTGGLVGYGTGGEISGGPVSGDVRGTGGTVSTGGIIGYSDVPVSDSYVTANVTGEFNTGGIAGVLSISGSVTDAYATGEINGGDAERTGGVIGYKTGDVEDAYWNEDTTGADRGIGVDDGGSGGTVALTTDEMQRFAPLETMDGLSFDNSETWKVTDGYPALAWEGATEITVDSVSAADATVASDSGSIEVTANEGDTDVGEGVTIEVTNADGLGDLSTEATAVTNTNGVATFSFSGASDGTYNPEFAWTDDTSVSDTATVTVDTTAPSVSGVSVSDDTDGDGVVADGDTIQITATVTDTNGIASIDADASAFDAGTVTLSDDGPNSNSDDNQYSATVIVGASPTEGDQSVTIDAYDEAGNGGSQSVGSGTLAVDTTAPTLNSDSGTTDEDTAAEVVPDLLENDDDATALSVTKVDGSAGGIGAGVAGGSGGTFTIASDGTVDFDPNGEFESLASGDSDTTQVTVTVTDAAGNADTQTVTATVTGVNDAPTLSTTASDPTFTEDGGVVGMFSGTAVSTVEGGQRVESFKVTVSNVADESAEVLSVDGSDVVLTDGNSVTTANNDLDASVSVTGSTAAVTVSGSMTAGTAQTVINGLSYEHTGDEPSTANDRAVTLTEVVDDGGTTNGGSDTWTGAQSGTVSLTAVNDAPEFDTGSPSSPSDDDPEHFTDPDEIRDEFELPENVTGVYAERSQPDVSNGNTILEFSDDAALETIESTGVSHDETSIVTLDTNQIGTENPPGTLVNVTDVRVPSELEDANATVTYRLSTDHLNASNTSPEDLSLYRHADGDWDRLNTTVTDESDDTVRVEATTPGFSMIGVSATSEPDPMLSVLPESVTAGEDVTLDGSDSTSEHDSITAYEWNINGETLTGETTDVTLDDPGTYTVELAVTNDAGETATITQNVTVEDDTTETDTPDDSTTDPAGTPANETDSETPASETDSETPANETDSETDDDAGSGVGMPGFGFAVAVGAILVVAVVLARRKA